MRCWHDYFTNSNIHGIDVYEHKELENGRIKIFVANQNSPEDLQRVIDCLHCELDIINDDGSIEDV